MQYSEIVNEPELSAVRPNGRLIGIDPGTKHIGVAISDELRLVARPLPAIARKSWKKLLADVQVVIAEYDAAALVVGLPLNTDGSESSMSAEARKMAAKYGMSLSVPVFLQDERVTSYEARKRLWEKGVTPKYTKRFVDSESATIILTDFMERLGRPTAGLT